VRQHSILYEKLEIHQTLGGILYEVEVRVYRENQVEVTWKAKSGFTHSITAKTNLKVQALAHVLPAVREALDEAQHNDPASARRSLKLQDITPLLEFRHQSKHALQP
jgi:hypothetical protein